MSLANKNPEPEWGDTSTFSKSEESAEKRQETRKTLEKLMAALKAQDRSMIQEAKAMGVWCKQCGHGFNLSVSAVNKDLECFQLLCPRCRELVIQIRTNNTAALGFLARIFQEERASSDTLSDHGAEIEHCLWAFQLHDYQRCIDLASPLVDESPHSYLVQMLIISAQRLGLVPLVEQVGQSALGPTANHSPWEGILLKLTLGLIGPEEAMKAARSDVDRCRVLFYTATRLITLGDKRRAKEVLKRCSRFELDFVEKPLVAAEEDLV